MKPDPPSDHRRSLPPEADAWLEAHPDPDRAGLEEAWRLAGLADEDAFVPDPGRVRGMEARLAAVVQAGARPPVSPVRSRRRVVGWATAGVLAVLVGLGLWWMRPVATMAPVGERVTVVLPDGSTAELNSGSRLAYRRSFGRAERRVHLDGEAFFDVVSDPTPFVVETFNSTVTVLGTRFNVRAWPESDVAGTSVVLAEGRVRLAADDAAVELAPGEASVVAAGRPAPDPPAPASLETALAWRQGAFRFPDAPLGEITDELERRTGARITFADPDLRRLRGAILLDRIENPASVLATLAEVRSLRVTRTDDGFMLSR